jgi:hypothetical protein
MLPKLSRLRPVRADLFDELLDAVEQIEVHLRPVGFAFGVVDQGRGFAGKYLAFAQELVFIPRAGFDEYRHDGEFPPLGPRPDPGQFEFLDELGIQKWLAHDQDGDVRLVYLLLDAPGEDLAGDQFLVIPEDDIQPLHGFDQLGNQVILVIIVEPPHVLAGIAHKDADDIVRGAWRLGHGGVALKVPEAANQVGHSVGVSKSVSMQSAGYDAGQVG